MNHFANRAFSTLSLALYLGLFAFVAKLSFVPTESISFSLPDISLFSPEPPQLNWMAAAAPIKIEKETIKNAETFKIKEVKSLKHAKLVVTAAKKIEMKPELIVAKPIETTPEKLVWKTHVVNKELPVSTIHNYLSEVKFESTSIQYAVLYNDIALPVETKLAVAEAPAQAVEDKISTSLASTVTVEDDLILYDYQDEAKPVEEQKTEVILADEKVQTIAPEVIHTQDVDKVEEIAVSDLLSFDYSKASAVSPVVTVNTVKTQEVKKPAEVKKAATPQVQAAQNEYSNAVTAPEDTTPQEGFVNGKMSSQERSSVVISAVSVDGKNLVDMKGFEVQFKDDANDYSQDLNNGQVVFTYNLNDSVAVRSAKLIATNHVITHTDLVLEKNHTPELIPVLTETYFNELQEGNKVNGGLLVKADQNVGNIRIDKNFSKAILLDGDLKESKNESYEFVYFANIPSGNLLVSFETNKKVINKIIHIHERELTYEKNIVEDFGIVQISMFEDNLLAKEKTPLNINAEELTEFTQQPRTEKTSLNTYKIPVGHGLYGERLYLEMAHLNESIFVGVGDNRKINIPSEDYLRLVLSNFPEGKLKSRCMVQVNLSKKATGVFHSAEGVEDALMTNAMMVDKDGRFHHSLSGKTEKIFIQGEYQGNSKNDSNGVVHVKVNYADGTNDYLKTFCSPNTYLVEQL